MTSWRFTTQPENERRQMKQRRRHNIQASIPKADDTETTVSGGEAQFFVSKARSGYNTTDAITALCPWLRKRSGPDSSPSPPPAKCYGCVGEATPDVRHLVRVRDSLKSIRDKHRYVSTVSYEDWIRLLTDA